MPNQEPHPVSDKECETFKILLNRIQPEFSKPKLKTPPILLVEEAQYELRQQKQSIPVEYVKPKDCVIDKRSQKQICKNNVMSPSNWLLLMMKSKAEKMKKERSYREVNNMLNSN
jgi:hypothetical protein